MHEDTKSTTSSVNRHFETLLEKWDSEPGNRIKVESDILDVVKDVDNYFVLCRWALMAEGKFVPLLQITTRLSVLNFEQLPVIDCYGVLNERLAGTPTDKQKKEVQARIIEICLDLTPYSLCDGSPNFFTYFLNHLDEVPEYLREAFLKKTAEFVNI